MQPIACSGYAYNCQLNHNLFLTQGKLQQNGKNESTIEYPSATVSIPDARIGIIGLITPDAPKYLQFAGAILMNGFNFDNETPGAVRHNGGGNHCFIENNAKWFQPGVFIISGHINGTATSFSSI